MRLGVLLILLACTAGCPELQSSEVPARCVKQYDKCKLPAGPLGVCDHAPCAAGEAAPCLKCMPQH